MSTVQCNVSTFLARARNKGSVNQKYVNYRNTFHNRQHLYLKVLLDLNLKYVITERKQLKESYCCRTVITKIISKHSIKVRISLIAGSQNYRNIRNAQKCELVRKSDMT
jgi:hypothetical protein